MNIDPVTIRLTYDWTFDPKDHLPDGFESWSREQVVDWFKDDIAENLSEYPMAVFTDIGDEESWIHHHLQEVTHEGAKPELMSALEAIKARINGVYDCPALVAFGPLHHDTQWDCLRIAEEAIAKAKGE